MPYVEIDGVELYYETAGEGPDLLLIHGLGSSSRDWETQESMLARQGRVTRIDLRGHGRSAKPAGPYSVPMFADETAALIRRLDLSPTHVIGISLGGMIGLELAVTRPQLVRSLVAINAPADTVLSTWRARWEFGVRLAVCELLGMPGTAGLLSWRLFPGAEQAELRETFRRRWKRNDRRAYLATLRGLVGWSVLDRLESIRCPTLLIAGEHDFIPLESKQDAAGRIPGAELRVIAGSRHATTADSPEELNALIEGFLVGGAVLPISARDMDPSERRYYDRHR